MTDYIDRQAAIKAFKEHFEDRGDIMARVCEVILNDIPTADVRENVKGEWLYVVEEIEGTTFCGRRCSKCNYWKGMGIFNFCPNCGADMNTPKKERHACRPL